MARGVATLPEEKMLEERNAQAAARHAAGGTLHVERV